MDANKLKKLKEIGYEVRRGCGNCKHASLYGFWGTCLIKEYAHLKHTNADRKLSVNSHGCCDDHEWADYFISQLGGFEGLQEK